MPLPVIGYVRVSTGKQAQLRSADGQEYELLKAGCDRVIRDVVTGTGTKRRPGWEELRLLVARRQVREIRFIDLSRLARDGSDQQLLEEAWIAGVRVVDTRGQEWENRTPAGLISSGVLSVINKAHSRMLSLKVKDGLSRLEEQGRITQSRMPFGYRLRDGRIEADPEHWEDARWLVEKLITEECNFSGTLGSLPAGFPFIPTVRGLTFWLDNPMLRGGRGRGQQRDCRKYDSIDWGVAPALITPAEWRQIVAMRARRRSITGRTWTKATTHLFTGMVCCKACQVNLHYQARKWKLPRYVCKNRRCCYHGRGLREVVIKQAVATALSKRAVEMASMAQAETAEVNPEVVKLEDQLATLMALADQGVGGLQGSIRQIRDQIALLETPAAVRPLDESLLDTFREPEAFLQAPDDDLRPVLLHWLDRVEYDGRPDVCRVFLR